VPMVDEALSEKSRDEWGIIFDAAGLIWGPVLGLHEVPQDSQAKDIGLFPTLQHETLGEYRTVNIPMRFRNTSVGPRSRSPKLGEHTDKVLADFGIENETISKLKDSNIISQT